MTWNFESAATARSSRRLIVLAAALLAVLLAMNAAAQAPAATGYATPARSAAELETLVGRIALYPDDLIAIILPASTNPIQIVQADRFLVIRKADPNLPVEEKWDDSVKALLNYPEVVKNMSSDLDWTESLGEAVVEDQGAVLEAVQVFRRKAHSAGNLKSDDKQQVVVEKEVITIVPANPEVIYVPQYDPAQVIVAGGYPYWGYYPWGYPAYWYPYAPGAAFAAGLIWGAAITAAWRGGHYVSHYGGGGNNNINIDRGQNINIGQGNRPSQLPSRGGSGSTQWKPDKKPGEVGRSGGRGSTARAGDGLGGAGGPRASTQPGGGRDIGGGGSRASTQPARSSAFGGANASGRDTFTNSSRGAASRNSMSGGGFGGGAGAGGGGFGGGGRGGGGGRR